MKKFLIVVTCLFLFCFQFAMPVSATEVPQEIATPKRPAKQLRDGDAVRTLCNLVIFIRFADDDEIDHDFEAIDLMFNGAEEGYPSVANFFSTLSYGEIHFNTVYASQVTNGDIHSFVATHPRGYYQPYSAENPIGYVGENPMVGISMREAQLLAEAIHYVDSAGLVPAGTVLDGDGDGYIDNLSFIVKGGTGEWGSILWPHMEYFPQDSIDYPVSIGGVLPNTFNFEFEGASPSLFSVHVFRHEMGHSLGLPDLYHYENYTNINPVGSWDMMGYPYQMNHTAAIVKHKYLHVGDEPIQITEDGTYTLLSSGAHSEQNCYYIKSAIDSTQWYTFEYRNQEDLFDEGIWASGLIVGRWVDTIPADYDGMLANPQFDYYTRANQYSIFRPGSNSDTIQGELNFAAFSAFSQQTTFGPETDPYPFLTDGTPETSFEITDIQEQGSSLTFTVRFLNTGVSELATGHHVGVYPVPAVSQVTLTGDNILCCKLYNSVGQCVVTAAVNGAPAYTMPLTGVNPGIYVMRVLFTDGSTVTKKIVKR